MATRKGVKRSPPGSAEQRESILKIFRVRACDTDKKKGKYSKSQTTPDDMVRGTQGQDGSRNKRRRTKTERDRLHNEPKAPVTKKPQQSRQGASKSSDVTIITNVPDEERLSLSTGRRQRGKVKSYDTASNSACQPVAITSNRLSMRVGIFNKGKLSSTIQRESLVIPKRTQQKAEKDLRRVLDVDNSSMSKMSNIEDDVMLLGGGDCNTSRHSAHSLHNQSTHSSFSLPPTPCDDEIMGPSHSHDATPKFHAAPTAPAVPRSPNMEDISNRLLPFMKSVCKFPTHSFFDKIRFHLNQVYKLNGGREENSSSLPVPDVSMKSEVPPSGHRQNHHNTGSSHTATSTATAATWRIDTQTERGNTNKERCSQDNDKVDSQTQTEESQSEADEADKMEDEENKLNQSQLNCRQQCHNSTGGTCKNHQPLVLEGTEVEEEDLMVSYSVPVNFMFNDATQLIEFNNKATVEREKQRQQQQYQQHGSQHPQMETDQSMYGTNHDQRSNYNSLSSDVSPKTGPSLSSCSNSNQAHDHVTGVRNAYSALAAMQHHHQQLAQHQYHQHNDGGSLYAGHDHSYLSSPRPHYSAQHPVASVVTEYIMETGEQLLPHQYGYEQQRPPLEEAMSLDLLDMLDHDPSSQVSLLQPSSHHLYFSKSHNSAIDATNPRLGLQLKSQEVGESPCWEPRIVVPSETTPPKFYPRKLY